MRGGLTATLQAARVTGEWRQPLEVKRLKITEVGDATMPAACPALPLARLHSRRPGLIIKGDCGWLLRLSDHSVCQEPGGGDRRRAAPGEAAGGSSARRSAAR
jgi:hypothetical protein